MSGETYCSFSQRTAEAEGQDVCMFTLSTERAGGRRVRLMLTEAGARGEAAGSQGAAVRHWPDIIRTDVCIHTQISSGTCRDGRPAALFVFTVEKS